MLAPEDLSLGPFVSSRIRRTSQGVNHMALLIRRDPFRDLLDIERNVSRMLEDYGATSGVTEESIVMPNIDMKNEGNDLIIHAEMPGIKPEDLDVSLSENMLTLRGESTQERETNEEDYVMRERRWGTFERTIQLPGHVTADQIEARYSDGVLEVTVRDAAQGRERQKVQIPLQGGGQQKAELPQQGQTAQQGQQGQQGQQATQQQSQQGSQQQGAGGGQRPQYGREEMREQIRSGEQRSGQGTGQQPAHGESGSR